jgi:site-specific recombinase XerD
VTVILSSITVQQRPTDTSGVTDTLSLLSAWRLTLEARDLSQQTVRMYVYGVWRLLEHHRFAVHPSDLTENDIASFLASLGARSPSKEHYAKGIRSFCSWLHRHGHLESDPVAEIRPRRMPPESPVRFERDEMARLLAAAEARDPRRRWAILACLGLGTRRTEFVSIRRADIDWGRMQVHLRVTKGRRPRVVPIGEWAAEALHQLELLSPAAQPLLLPIQPNTLNDWVHQAADDAEIVGERKQRAHTLRATFASYLLDDGVPIHVVSKLLGHSNIAATTPYAAVGPGAPEEAVARLGTLPEWSGVAGLSIQG